MTTTALLNPFVFAGDAPASDATIVINYPGNNDKIPENGYWAAQATVTPNGETISAVEMEYSTDYTGDEDAATWVAVADDGDTGWTEASDVHEYVGNAVTVPSGVVAIRFILTDADSGQASDIQDITSEARVVEVEEDFTDTDGTDIDTSYTLDTGGNITFRRSVGILEVQSNRCEIVADQDWGAVSQKDIATQTAMAECTVNVSQADDSNNGTGIAVSSRVSHSQVYFNNYCARYFYDGADRILDLYRGTAAVESVTVTASTSNSTDYVVHIQNMNQVQVAAIRETGGTLISAIANFGSSNFPAAYDGANIHIAVNGNILDDWTVWSFD